jgi:PAS domain-containing protein
MNRVAVQFLDQGFHRMLFDAMPVPVFVVDEDVRILECNAAAVRLFGPDKYLIVRRRGGEVLHCVHAKEVPEGCGRAPTCPDCPVRKAVQAASRGQRVTRQEARMELAAGGKTAKVDLQISCSAFTYERSTFILLVLEGLKG